MKKNNYLSSLWLAGLCALLAFLSITSVQAHQQKTAITSVLFNSRTKNIEISHRFNLHDAEHAVKAIFDKSANILGSEETQTEFANYVTARFSLLNDKDTTIALKTIGFEIEGRYFWVYQESKQPPELSGLKIRHDALRDLWPNQINTLNVEGIGEVKTLTFSETSKLLEVHF